MDPVSYAVSILCAALVCFSAVAKLRRDPKVVRVVNEIVGVPLKYFPLLAACEFAGAAGLLLGLLWPPLGLAAAVGLVLYFLCAAVSHLRVGDSKGIGPAAFMLLLAAAVIALRVRG